MIQEITQQFNIRMDRVKELNLRIATGDTTCESVDFSELESLSYREQNVLPVTEEALESSFQTGMSAVFINGNRAIGHVRFVPLLDERLRGDLGLRDTIPQIWEMGTGLMLEEYRGRGINIVLRNVLISKFRAELASGNLLAIATTKTPELRSLVDNMAELFNDPQDPYPIDFAFTNRANIPFIAPFTCVCTPDFGIGYQFGTSCNQAEVASQNTVGYRRGMELPLINNGSTGNKIACTVFLSSTKLTEETELQLSEHFNTQQNLVSKLKERSYF